MANKWQGVTTDNYDGGKGLELIPLEMVEVAFPSAAQKVSPVRSALGRTFLKVERKCAEDERDLVENTAVASRGQTATT